MVSEHAYDVLFINRASFRTCPKFLVCKALYEHIKRVTCLNSTRDCRTCDLKDRCIFHRLSGEYFARYPAILVERNLIEKQDFEPRETLTVRIRLIGNTEYRGYIDGFFDQMTMIKGFPVMVRKGEAVTLNSGVLENRVVNVMTPVVGRITDQIEYYRSSYQCDFQCAMKPDIVDERKVHDRRSYRIDRCRIMTSGWIGKIHVTRIDERLLRIGFGKTNFMGGGKTQCE